MAVVVEEEAGRVYEEDSGYVLVPVEEVDDDGVPGYVSVPVDQVADEAEDDEGPVAELVAGMLGSVTVCVRVRVCVLTDCVLVPLAVEEVLQPLALVYEEP